jgi:hypothetical protein
MGAGFLLAMLAGCGGGGGSSTAPTPTPPAPSPTTPGLWQGTFTSTTAGVSGSIVGIITTTGAARFISLESGIQIFGTVPTTGSSLSASLTGVTPTGQTGTYSLSGTATAKSSLSGTYSGLDAGSFSFTYNSAFTNGASLATISGTWTQSRADGYTVTITVDPSGAINGSDTLGCVYAGTATVPDAAYNYYSLSISLSSCGAYSGAYSGLATIINNPAGGTNNELIYQANNNSYVSSGVLTK